VDVVARKLGGQEAANHQLIIPIYKKALLHADVRPQLSMRWAPGEFIAPLLVGHDGCQARQLKRLRKAEAAIGTAVHRGRIQ